MQTAMYVCGKKNSSLSDFQIPFERKGAQPTAEQIAERVANSKAGWDRIINRIGPRPNESPQEFEKRRKKIKAERAKQAREGSA